MSAAVNVTVSFSAPSANSLIVADVPAVPTHVFVTGILIVSVFVFLIVNPVAAVPEISFAYPAIGVSSTV